MLNEKLLTKEYYFNKLPLYLQNDTFFSHFQIWLEFLRNINNYSDELLDMINIFQEDYLTKYGDNCNEFLDFLGQLYGVSRNFSVRFKYNGVLQPVQTLNLTQEEFLLLIKCQIKKSFYDGSLEQLKEFYNDISSDFDVKFIFDKDTPAHLTFYLQSVYTGSFTNIQSMFLSGLLTTDILGVTIDLKIVDNIASILIWDNSSTGLWDYTLNVNVMKQIVWG